MNANRIFLGLLSIAIVFFGYTQLVGTTSVEYATPATVEGNTLYSDAGSSASKAAEGINWLTWAQMLEARKTNPKPVMIDMYTDWCGWCKRMDKSTFSDADLAAYVNENFHAVKFNAERKDDIVYDGHTFKYKKHGRRGVHELAASMLDNRLSYPTIVYFNGEMQIITVSPGYKDAAGLMNELEQVVATTKK